MREITLDSITDEQAERQEMLLINMIRTKYPKLDIRRGTVLRDLLVDADAAVGAMFSGQAEEQRLSSSLLVLSERSSSGEEVDQDDVNAILSNFNMESVSGTKATGYVRVVVSSGSTSHVVMAGVQFKTVDGVYFTVTSDTTASSAPSGNEVIQHQGAPGLGTFWYLVPVMASENGSNGNIGQGTALEPTTSLADFVSASAYATFSGGSDLEDLRKTVERIKSSLSARSLTTHDAVEAQLRDRYDSTDNHIVSVSVCGYGNPAQLRDKHNLFGTAVGGRADIYVRNFTELPVFDNKSETGYIVEDPDGYSSGTANFTIHLSHDRIPGAIFVYSISDPSLDTLSSYQFNVRYSGNTEGVWHDFDISNDPTVHELANTVWRDIDITVIGVPVTSGDIDSGTRQFRVVVVALPDARGIQDYVDDGLVRNVAADYVVRGPMIVNMSVNAVVRYRYSTGFDSGRAVSKICEYVNTTGFVGRITRSEISSILIGMGAVSVDLFDENDMLYGYVYDANGERHDLYGDALDIDSVETKSGMLTRDTAVFVLEPSNVHITTIAVNS